ncbi:hypothetical protein BVG16_01480 [Paenibacillus selenitireducens]|uniref:HTH deoR-type domain-containing protein n=1 Tax=Paenibacillus selenitireducens TaxID=1324314 RepID=A0A1T2XMJ3_9BACL|nr:DeoR/GlpR family DNA-binding transcription regulator [Paenibacillus selenitireducens]OPA81042.1 hypothetical protein BVG16_01480 [Paenibacillus selenitireducens]
MLSFERQQQILDILKEHKCVHVDFLCKKLFASGATIRRDLSEMHEKGLITRVRGGAALIEGTNQDAPLLVRSNENRAKKEYIAQLALRYVHDSATIFMDSSSTVTFLADKLEGFRDLSIVTNGIATMNSLNEYTTAKVFSSGGLIRNNSSFVGQIAMDSIYNFRADMFFFSCCGLSIEGGCTEADEDNAAIKKQMWKNAKKRILLCDSTKVNHDFFCKVCDIQDMDVILMDQPQDQSSIEDLIGTGIIVNK